MSVLVTSMPTVIDGLLLMWRNLALVDGGGAPITIFDGMPGKTIPDLFVQIGGYDLTTAVGAQDWQSLGTSAGGPPTRDENYEIACLVSAYVGGGADSDILASAQKNARDNAYTVLAALERAVRNDSHLVTTLGGSGIGTGWLSFGLRIELQQTWPDTQDHDPALGRRANFLFTIGVYHRLYGT